MDRTIGTSELSGGWHEGHQRTRSNVFWVSLFHYLCSCTHSIDVVFLSPFLSVSFIFVDVVDIVYRFDPYVWSIRMGL